MIRLTVLSVCVVRLSQRDRTVIVSIHQPRFAIFQLFDRLTLLAAGKTVYHGKASEALGYFNALGTFSWLLSCFMVIDNKCNKKLSCRRETARHFLSLNILLSRLRSFEMTLLSRACVSPY